MRRSWRDEALAPATQRSLAERVLQHDALRLAPSLGDAGGRWKEWTHFVVCHPEVTLLVNLSWTEERPAPGAPVERVPRLTLLVREHGAGGRPGAWWGDAVAYAAEATDATPGRVDACVGPHTVRFVDGAWHLSVDLAARSGVRAELVIRPVTLPSATTCLPFGGGTRVSWLVFPRCLAWGEVVVGAPGRARTVRLEGAACYHDHNWGAFDWGGDWGWTWGFAVPEDPDNPWSAVFSRVTDARRHSTRIVACSVWHGTRYAGMFHDEAVRYTPKGWLRPREVPLLPRGTGLLRQGTAVGIPAALTVQAEGPAGEVEVSAELRAVAGLVLPSAADLGATQCIHEVDGRVRVRGRLGGEAVGLEGPAVLEFVHGAA